MSGRACPTLPSLLASRGLREEGEWAILISLLREGPHDATNVTWRARTSTDALGVCLERGLVRRITDAEAKADRLRWDGDRNESVSSEPYEERFFDLAQAGASLVTEILAAQAGGDPWRHACGIREGEGLHATVFAVRKAVIVRCLDSLRAHAEAQGLAFECTVPRHIHRWWIHRAIPLQRGWRAEVRRWCPPTDASRRAHAILDRHRVSVPEYWVLRHALHHRWSLSRIAEGACGDGDRNPLGPFGVREAEAAVARLCARRLLTRVTEVGIPFPGARPGAIHLTRMGARLIIMIEDRIAGAEGRTRFHGVIWNNHRGLVRAARREDLEAAQRDPRAHAPRPALGASAGPIRQGGAYRPHPFDLVTETWEMDLHVEWKPRPRRAGTDRLTEAEDSVLSSVWLLPSVNRHQIAIHARNVACKGAHPEYATALESLLERGLLRVLTPEECAADAARWQEDDQNACADTPYRPGCIALTARGHAHSLGGTLGDDARILPRYISSVREAMFCSDPDRLRRALFLDLGDTPVHADRRRIRRVTGPYLVSHCWVDRFTRLAPMWRADVEYEASEHEGQEEVSSG